MDLHSLAVETAAKQARSEAEAFEKEMHRVVCMPHCDDHRIEQIAAHYGFSSQANMLCEEAAEFMVALNKLRRGNPDAYAAVKEEVADVLIVARQMRYLLGYEDIDRIISRKLDRQIRRINDEKECS